MKWSQLKKRVESLFADSVRGRAELHTTRYRKDADQVGRAWITLDRKEVINMCSWKAEWALYGEAKRLQEERGCTDWTDPAQRAAYKDTFTEARATLHANSVFFREEFHAALFDFLNTPIENALRSPNPLIRAVAVLDRRLGKRRLAGLSMKDEHPIAGSLNSGVKWKN